MPTSRKVSYQQLQDELDLILQKLQGSNQDIDEMIKEYERGLKIVEELRTYLTNAENTINKITTSTTKKVSLSLKESRR